MIIAVVAFVVLIGLMFFNIPIAISTGFAALIGIYMSDDLTLTALSQNMFSGLDSFTLIAIPLFILTGSLMSLGGITRDLIDLSKALVGFLRGGLAYVNIVSSVIFGGISGSATADSASVGSVLIPAMTKKGFDKDFSVAVTATSSTIGVMIPPSIPMVIFGVSAGVSIGKLFLGGVIPGLLVAIALMAVTYVIAKKRDYPVEEKIKLKESLKIFFRSIPALFTILILIGGIISGIFTATEAAGVAALYSFLLGVFYYKELKLKDIPKMILNTAATTGMVALMISTASALGYLLTIEGIPSALGDLILSVTDNQIIILLLMILLLLFVGAFMDLSPAVIIFTPVLLPIVTALGMDIIHFGVVMVVALAIGLFTPPVGVVLFVTSGIANIQITDTIKALIPYLLAMIFIVLLIAFVPQLVMFLPNLLMP